MDECARYLDGLIHDCMGLEVSREAVRVGDDTVVFDWIRENGQRPSCTCLPILPREEGEQCLELVQRSDAGEPSD